MKCISPVRLKQKEGFIDVPCGRCVYCHRERVLSWTIRCLVEAQSHLYNYFLTLTYNDESLPVKDDIPVLKKEDVQLYFKRLRKKNKFRYFLLGEYGTHTWRPHYHAIIFSDKEISLKDFQESWTVNGIDIGFVKLGNVSPASVKYCCKYHADVYSGKNDQSFNLSSRRPGIGGNYLKGEAVDEVAPGEFSGLLKWHQENGAYYIIINGIRHVMPKYLQRKIFTAEQRKSKFNESKLIEDKEVLKNKNYYKNKFDVYERDFVSEQRNKKSKI